MPSPRRVIPPRRRLQRLPEEAARPEREEIIRRARKKRRRRRLVNILLLIIVATALGLFLWAEQNRRRVLNQLQAKENELQQIEGSSGLTADEVNEVLEKVGELINLPTDPKPSVATIVNVADLRKTSDFYNQAEDGDFLVVTEHRAILFDPEREIIVDVVPLQKVEEPPLDQIPAPPEAASDVAASPTLPAASPSVETELSPSPVPPRPSIP